ncbi:APC family permease [Fodinicola acaciae]|uniref:APC family permease n=1 Tax=Fodinicola acaciae TaxID=2681555 RepID=UPI001C9E4C1C|nr:APC family permease [Fodinicola acaciae]
MAAPAGVSNTHAGEGKLRRDVGFWGLMFVSLGSIIGSGWLLGALHAASAAGPASLLSWILAAIIMSVLALVHAELGAAYPVAGGTARFPLFAFGSVAGFTAGWAAWLQAVTLAPIEVEASIGYLDGVPWIKQHLDLLHPDQTLTVSGIFWGSVLMVIFLVINIVGVKFLSESNTVTVIWKTLVPLLAVIVLVTVSFHPGNFTAGGGFLPNGVDGIFAALPLGVAFALQGFEQCIQLGGEARNPQKDLSRAIITAVAIGTVIYIALEVAFIGSLNPADILHNWNNPISGQGATAPYAALAVGAGAGWLAFILYVDAFISPAGTGLLYLGTSARLSYALGRDGQLPKRLGKVSLRGIPLWSIILAFVVGEIMFLPFPSWQSLVGVVTGATFIMYAYAPISLYALRKRDAGRARPYRLPAMKFLAPVAFIFANLVIYWGGFDTTWKIIAAMVVGVVIFEITQVFTSPVQRVVQHWRSAMWVPPWLLVTVLIGWLGRYGGGLKLLPDWIDLLVVAAFSLVIFYWGVSVAMTSEEVNAAVEKEALELAVEPEIRTA